MEQNSEPPKKKYMDKSFKKQLFKALTVNLAEPNNIDKIRGNRTVKEYSEKKIVEFVNSVAEDVQKGVEDEISDPEACSTFQLAYLVKDISDTKKSQELNLVMKLKSEAIDIPHNISTHSVDFRGLTRFLYTSMSGLPDSSSLNQESRQVLLQTHNLLMEQINKDATPEFLEELKSNICAGGEQQPHVGVESLAEAFQDKNLNPFGFPFEFLLKGSLPPQNEPDVDVYSNRLDNEPQKVHKE